MGMWVSSEKLPMISTVALRKGNQMCAGPLTFFGRVREHPPLLPSNPPLANRNKNKQTPNQRKNTCALRVMESAPRIR